VADLFGHCQPSDAARHLPSAVDGKDVVLAQVRQRAHAQRRVHQRRRRDSCHVCHRHARPPCLARLHSSVALERQNVLRSRAQAWAEVGSPAIARNNANAKRRYASAEQTDSWSFWGGSSYSKPKPAYKPTSANDPRFLKAQKRAAPVYYYSQSTGQVYVRKSQGARIVYQRAPRKVYYNGYGYGSSNW
jgi:hypothetical protein